MQRVIHLLQVRLTLYSLKERPLGIKEAEDTRMYGKCAGNKMGYTPRLIVESLPGFNGKVQDTVMSRLQY
jgi:hypothetical protein